MKTKFTKGEWRYEKTAHGNFVMIGNYCAARTTDFSGTEETQANAKLMAASPDLLKACIQALRFVDVEETAYYDLELAIKKAIN